MKAVNIVWEVAIDSDNELNRGVAMATTIKPLEISSKYSDNSSMFENVRVIRDIFPSKSYI